MSATGLPAGMLARASPEEAREALAAAASFALHPVAFDGHGGAILVPHDQAEAFGLYAVVEIEDGTAEEIWLADFADEAAASSALLALYRPLILFGRPHHS